MQGERDALRQADSKISNIIESYDALVAAADDVSCFVCSSLPVTAAVLSRNGSPSADRCARALSTSPVQLHNLRRGSSSSSLVPPPQHAPPLPSMPPTSLRPPLSPARPPSSPPPSSPPQPTPSMPLCSALELLPTPRAALPTARTGSPISTALALLLGGGYGGDGALTGAGATLEAPRCAKRKASNTGSARRSKQLRRDAQQTPRKVALDELMTPGSVRLVVFDEAVKQLNKQLTMAWGRKARVKVKRGDGRGYPEIRADVRKCWRALLGESGTVTIGVPDV